MGNHLENNFNLLLGVLLVLRRKALADVPASGVISIFVSTMLYRIVAWLCAKNWPRWAGILVATLTLLLVIAVCLV